MKCKYSYCKFDGEVDKKDAIKIGNLYYHKECLCEKELKQQIENYYIKNMPSCTLQILRKVIKQLIHEKNVDADFVLYTVKYIKKNNKPINNPFALLNYCNDNRIISEYKDNIVKERYKKINNFNSGDENISFQYKPNKKNIPDII